MASNPKPRPVVIQPEDPNYRIIALTKGQVCLVDTEDYEWAMQWYWFAKWAKNTKSFYAARSTPKGVDGKQKTVRLHRAIMCRYHDLTEEQEVDHENHDTLNDRKTNLRIATLGQNNQNTRMRVDNTSGVKGVHFVPGTKRRREKWVAQIMVNKKTIHLGNFKTKEEAETVREKAADELHGEFANY